MAKNTRLTIFPSRKADAPWASAVVLAPLPALVPKAAGRAHKQRLRYFTKRQLEVLWLPRPNPSSLGLGLPWSCFRLDVKGVASGCLPLPRGQDEKSSHGSAAQSCCRFHVEPLAGDASECAGSACSERAEPASRRAAPSHAQPRSGEQAADCTSGERGTTGQFNIEGRVLSWTGQSDPVNISFVLVVPV
jgi:hypothetical protein